LGNRLTFTLHKPLAVSDFDFAELMEDRNSSSERNKILIYKNVNKKHSIRSYAVLEKTLIAMLINI
jgi:hypothetical protein